MASRIGTAYDRPEVTLADGTILHADVSASGRALWIWIRDENDPFNSISILSDLLNNPVATERITRTQRGRTVEYSGYTKLTTVRMYDTNHACARLWKEEEPDV